MDKRIRLGFVYLWDESWLGGVYYAQNLLKALNTLQEKKKPIVHLYCLSDKAYKDLSSNTCYPYMEKTIIKVSLWKQVLRKIGRYFVKEKADAISLISLSGNDDVIYPWCGGKATDKMVYWIPDFQEKYLPELFSPREVKSRDYYINSCCKRGIPIVFSSADARNDFKKFFPQFNKHLTYVVRFAAILPDFSKIDISDLIKKYNIEKRYLFCSNQFWKHKNHLFLFKAFKKAVDNGLDMQLVCTGRMEDNRNPQYSEDIRNFICSNHLENRILTLGMIDKLELYCLMKNSYAVIQPSLFEGWNTTVEDCKAMSKFIFLSGINVHREQLDKNVCFFDPYDEDDLVNKLLTVNPIEETYNYDRCIRQFGEDFYAVLKTRCQQ